MRSGGTLPKNGRGCSATNTTFYEAHSTDPSAPDIPSMGVYTPDSTTNSVHSLHYGTIKY